MVKLIMRIITIPDHFQLYLISVERYKISYHDAGCNENGYIEVGLIIKFVPNCPNSLLYRIKNSNHPK